MKPVGVMVAASLGSWVAASVLLDPRTRVELLYGMLGPLACVSASWLLVERAHRRDPQTVTPVMIWAFFFKVVFVGAYVVAMLRGLSLRPAPFVASFVSYFSGLYLMEALYLRRMFK